MLKPQSFLTFFLHWLIVSQRKLYGALVVTLAMLLRFINCRFIIFSFLTIIIIIISSSSSSSSSSSISLIYFLLF